MCGIALAFASVAHGLDRIVVAKAVEVRVLWLQSAWARRNGTCHFAAKGMLKYWLARMAVENRVTEIGRMCQ